MEQDRFQKNHTLFILGMLSLIACLSLLALTFYILPFLLFGWIYDVPGFIVGWVDLIQMKFNYTPRGASRIVFLIISLLTLFFGLFAFFSSNKIDNEIYSSELKANIEPKKIKTDKMSDAQRLALNILLIMVAIFVGAKVFEWLIYTPPPQTNQF